MLKWMGRSDCRVAVNCAFGWRGSECGFVGTGGPTQTSRCVIENVIGTLLPVDWRSTNASSKE